MADKVRSAASTGAADRRLLVVSYYFPPDSAVGGLRLGKFARCLPEFGWRPFVLTVNDACRDQGLDEERMKGLEHVSIVRTRELPGLSPLYRRLKSWVGRLKPLGRPVPGKPPGTVVRGDNGTRSDRGETATERLKRYLVSLVMLLPDEKKKWAFGATFTAVRLVRAHDIDCIFTSSPPASLHVVGLVAKMLTGVTWVADFRYPWLETVLHERPRQTRSWASDRIERWMERVVMTRADKVVTTTGRLRDVLRQRYPLVPADRFIDVPNSIDTEKFHREETTKYVPLTITYAGTLYIDRTPEPLFQAVGELIRSGALQPSDLRIKLLGNCRTVNGIETRSIADKYGVGPLVEILDFVPHSEAIRVMQRSHLLLVLAPDHHRYIVPAKMYDYLGSGTKVLALAEDGATSDLMVETSCGRCFSQSDIAGVRDYLHGLLQDRAFRHLKNDPQAFSRYDARHLTGRLAAELHACQPGSPGGRLMVRA